MNPTCSHYSSINKERLFHHTNGPSKNNYTTSNDKTINRTRSSSSDQRLATHVHMCGTYHATCEQCIEEIRKVETRFGSVSKKMIDSICECDGFMRSAPIDIPKTDANYKRFRVHHSIQTLSKVKDHTKEMEFELDQSFSFEDNFDNDFLEFNQRSPRYLTTDDDPESRTPNSKSAYAPVFLDDSDGDDFDADPDENVISDSDLDRSSFVSYDFDNDNDTELFFKMDM